MSFSDEDLVKCDPHNLKSKIGLEVAFTIYAKINFKLSKHLYHISASDLQLIKADFFLANTFNMCTYGYSLCVCIYIHKQTSPPV